MIAGLDKLRGGKIVFRAPAETPRLAASLEVQADRLAICATCDRNVNGQCKDCVTCGAQKMVAVKIAAALERCPNNLWLPHIHKLTQPVQ